MRYQALGEPEYLTPFFLNSEQINYYSEHTESHFLAERSTKNPLDKINT